MMNLDTVTVEHIDFCTQIFVSINLFLQIRECHDEFSFLLAESQIFKTYPEEL